MGRIPFAHPPALETRRLAMEKERMRNTIPSMRDFAARVGQPLRYVRQALAGHCRIYRCTPESVIAAPWGVSWIESDAQALALRDQAAPRRKVRITVRAR